jgi:transcriptional regulator with XRE-family HTH domain
MAAAAETVGERVRRYRRLRKLTQEQLADTASVDRSYLGKIETGVIVEPGSETLKRLARSLEIPLRSLAEPMGWYDGDSPDVLAAAEAELLNDPKIPPDLRDLAVGAVRMARRAREEQAG